MTNKEKLMVRGLATYYLKCFNREVPSRFKLFYIEAPSGSRLDVRDTLDTLCSDKENMDYVFAMRFLSRFDAMCEVLNSLDGSTYASLFESFDIPFGGVE